MDVTRITVPGPLGADHVNCYLLPGDPVTLIDTGPRDDAALDALQDGVQDAGRTLADIDRILLTHPHSDHFGNASRVVAASDATVYMHADAAPIVADYAAHRQAANEFFADFFARHGMPREVARETINSNLPDPGGASVAVDEPLQDGDDVAAGGTTLTCINAPGHAQGNVVFHARDDTAFTGDTVLSNITPNPALQYPGDGEEPPRSLVLYLETLDMLLDRDLGRGFGGHGPPMEDVHARIREIIAHHDRREARTYDLLADGPMTAFAAMQALFDDLPEHQYYFGMSEAVGHLELLVDRGRAEKLGGEQVRYAQS